MFDVGLHAVLESFAWSALVPPSRAQFTIHELLWQPVVVHPDHVTNPSKLGFQYHGLNAGHLGSVQDFEVCDPVMPVDVHN